MLPLYDINPTRRTPVVTMGLVAVNVVVFLAVLNLPEAQRERVFLHGGFVPARIAQLRDPEPILVPHSAPGYPGRPLQWDPAPGQVALSMVTCMFLHGGWMHLIGNMWFLWIFGNNCEDRLGHLLFLLYYLVGGLVASLCHWWVEPASTVPMVGASGAVAAVLGGYAVTWPWARIRTLVFLFVIVTLVDVPALIFLGLWFFGQLLAGSQQGPVENVAWWAHVGGFVAGAVLMPFLGRLSDEAEPLPYPE